MERSYIFLIVTILLLVFVALFSLGLIAKSKENDYNFALSPARSKYFGCLGLFSSALFSIILIFGIANGWYDPENQIETKTEAVTSVEKKDDIMTINNNDNYKIIIDFGNNSTEVYQNGKKLEGVRVRGPQWLMQYQIEDLKSNKSVIKTDYNITRKGDLKSIEVYISKNKNKDDFKVEY
jgi:hypothetical protein